MADIVRQPGRKILEDSPTDYIIVNDPSLLGSETEHSCVILFDWKTFIENVIAAKRNPRRKEIIETFNRDISTILEDQQYSTDSGSLYGTLNKAINNSLLDFNVTLTNRLGSNSCNFSLENFEDKWIIKNKDSDFYGQSIIQEGIRFTIDARGRFDTENFYRIYTGAISDIVEVSNPTDRALRFGAVDPSRFLSTTRYNVNPAVHETDLLAAKKTTVPFSSNIQGVNGGVILSRLLDKSSKNDHIELQFPYLWEILTAKDDDSVNVSEGDNRKTGVGLPVDQKGVLKEAYQINWHIKRSKVDVQDYNYDKVHKPYGLIWGHTGSLYTKLFGSINLLFSEFKTKLDIINDITNLTFFVSYIDGAGNFHYHPPRFEENPYINLSDGIAKGVSEFSITNGVEISSDGNRKVPLAYCVFDDDNLAQTYSQSDKEVVTVARGQAEGGFGVWKSVGDQVDPNTYKSSIVWEDGINRFGFREITRTTSAVKNASEMLNMFTASFLLRANQERFHMTTSMPMRPELQVDRPIYDVNKDKIYYIRSVTHTYSAGGPTAGGTYSTDIICNAGRRPNQFISSNVFAISDLKGVTDFKAFVKKYASFYNLQDLRTMPYNKNKEKQVKESKRKI